LGRWILAEPPRGTARCQNALFTRICTIGGDGGPITPDHLSLQPELTTPLTSTTDLRETERRTIDQVLRETSWNKARAARQLGLTRTQLYVRLRKYDIEKLQPAYEGWR
jgi:transcriptional regulator with GAF, ATPase, and Fis domain